MELESLPAESARHGEHDWQRGVAVDLPLADAICAVGLLPPGGDEADRGVRDLPGGVFFRAGDLPGGSGQGVGHSRTEGPERPTVNDLADAHPRRSGACGEKHRTFGCGGLTCGLPSFAV